MRKVTKDSIDAFYAGRCWSNSKNTEVWVNPEDGTVLFLLHGNAIARRKGSRVEISAAGWATNTTKERLGGLLWRVGGSIWQSDFQWYWNGPESETNADEFDTRQGQWTTVTYGSDLEKLASAKEGA
jgi:hypothetical protein